MAVEIGEQVVHQFASLVLRSVPQPPLADEDGQVFQLRVLGLRGGDGGVYVFFQRGGVLGGVDVGALQGVVHVDEVEGAGRAGADEVFEVGEAALAAAVGHGGRAELDRAGVGLHVFSVDGRGLFGCEVRFAGVVGFVGSVGLGVSG